MTRSNDFRDKSVPKETEDGTFQDLLLAEDKLDRLVQLADGVKKFVSVFQAVAAERTEAHAQYDHLIAKVLDQNVGDAKDSELSGIVLAFYDLGIPIRKFLQKGKVGVCRGKEL